MPAPGAADTAAAATTASGFKFCEWAAAASAAARAAACTCAARSAGLAAGAPATKQVVGIEQVSMRLIPHTEPQQSGMLVGVALAKFASSH